MLFGVGGLIWFFVPFLDKKSHMGIRSRFWTWFGIFLVVYIIILTIWGYLV